MHISVYIHMSMYPCCAALFPQSDILHGMLTPNLDLYVRSLVGVLLALAGRRSADAFAVGGASRHAIGRRSALSGAPVVRLPCRCYCRPAHRGPIFRTPSCTAHWTWGETSQCLFDSCHAAPSLAVSPIRRSSFLYLQPTIWYLSHRPIPMEFCALSFHREKGEVIIFPS